jgi:hypothetical protein
MVWRAHKTLMTREQRVRNTLASGESGATAGLSCPDAFIGAFALFDGQQKIPRARLSRIRLSAKFMLESIGWVLCPISGH